MSRSNVRLTTLTAVAALFLGATAGPARAADQWFDPGVAAGVQGGIAAWDTGIGAWSMTSGGTTIPVPWTNGNNAFLSANAGSTITVNGVTANLMIFTGTGPWAFLPGSGPLTITGSLTNTANAAITFGADILMNGDQTWFQNNNFIMVTGRLSGASGNLYQLTKSGPSGTLTLSNSANAFSSLVVAEGFLRTLPNALGNGTGLILGTTGQASRATLLFDTTTAPGSNLTVVGAITNAGAAEINLTTTVANSTNVLSAQSLERSGRATLMIAPGAGSSKTLGTDIRLYLTSADVTNGILAPWVLNYEGADVYYLSNGPNGLVTAPFDTGAWTANKKIRLTAATNLTSDAALYGLKFGSGLSATNSATLTLGDGRIASLVMGNRDGSSSLHGTGTISFGSAELIVYPGGGTSFIGPTLSGSGGLTLMGRYGGSGTLLVSNLTYEGETVLNGGVLNVSPAGTLTFGGRFRGVGTLGKSGPGTLIVTSSNTLGGFSPQGGNLVLTGSNASYNALNFSASFATLSLSNGGAILSPLAVNVGSAAGSSNNLLEVIDGTLGIPGNNSSWGVGALGSTALNRMTVTRSKLYSSTLSVGYGSSNNTVSINGPDTLWNFGGGNLQIGNPPATGNVVIVNGGGVADGVILTNIATLYVGQGGNSLSMSGNRLEIANGASVYVTAGPVVGSGNNSSITSNNVLRLGGGTAPCFLRSAGGLSTGGGGNSNAFCGGNTIEITNTVIYTTGSSMAGPNNTLTVRAGTWWDAAGGSYSIGGGGISNSITVDGGIVTNVGRILFNAATGTFALVNGARLIGTGSGNGNGLFDGARGGNLIVSNGSLLVYVRAIDFATAGGFDNRFLIDNAVVTNAVGAAMTIAGVANVSLISRNNSLVITNGGRLYGGSTLTVGNSGAYTNSGVYGNSVVVTGPGSLLDNGGQAITIGSSLVASNNSLVLANGGRVLRTGTLSVGVASTNNSALVGAGCVLEVAALTVGASVPGLANTIANTGGVYQFTAAAPTVTRGANGVITLTGGVLSFRAVTTANVKGNWSTTLTNITYDGANAFRLDNATNNFATSQSYWFDTDRGNTNFAGLELFNGGTAYTNGTVTIGTNGWLTFSNTQSAMWGPVTNYGVMSVYDSTVTFKSNLTLAEGSTHLWSTNNTTNAITVLGPLALPSALTVVVLSEPGKGESPVLINAPGGITGSPNGWTVVPSSYRVVKEGTTLSLLRKNSGTLILVN